MREVRESFWAGVGQAGGSAALQTRAKYNYFDAEPELHEKVVALEAVCAKHSVPLAAAALRFPLMHPAVTSVVCGVVRTMHTFSCTRNKRWLHANILASSY